MKKLFIFLLLISGAFTAKTQVVTFEKEIQDSTEWIYGVYNSNDIVFFLLNGDAKVYDKDLNFIKSFEKSTFGEKVQEINDISKNIFTTDGKYEITIQYILQEDSIFEDNGDFSYIRKTYGYKVCNESGATLFDFEEYQPHYHSLTRAEWNMSTSKLIANKEQRDNNYNYFKHSRIYSLPNYTPYNNTSSKQLTNPSKKSIRSYPNPSKESITIEYDIQGTALQSMEIINISGKIIDRILINPSEKSVQVNTRNYASGTYIYRIGQSTGKFIIQ